MNSKTFQLIILALIITGLHLAGIFLGLYERQIPVDVPQHVLAGVAFALVWLWWLKPEHKAGLSKGLVFVSILGFATLLGVAWEVLEFVVWKLFPTFAGGFKFYSPTVGELLGDVLANTAGSVLSGFFVLRKIGTIS